MSLFRRNSERTKTGKQRVVATGKRVRGTWTMESTIAPGTRRARRPQNTAATANARVRTLH